MAHSFHIGSLKKTVFVLLLLYHHCNLESGDAGVPLLLMTHNNLSDGDVTFTAHCC